MKCEECIHAKTRPGVLLYCVLFGIPVRRDYQCDRISDEKKREGKQ